MTKLTDEGEWRTKGGSNWSSDGSSKWLSDDGGSCGMERSESRGDGLVFGNGWGDNGGSRLSPLSFGQSGSGVRADESSGHWYSGWSQDGS